MEAEIAKNQAALDKATAIREKQLSEFNAEEKVAFGSRLNLEALDVATIEVVPNRSS